MAFLEQWIIPLVLVAAVFVAIYLNRPGASRGGARVATKPGSTPPAGPTPSVFSRGRGGRNRELDWVPIQSAIGSERALMPTAQLLRQNGVDARVVRVALVPGRRLMRLAVRQGDLRRAREILSREDLYVRTRLHS